MLASLGSIAIPAALTNVIVIGVAFVAQTSPASPSSSALLSSSLSPPLGLVTIDGVVAIAAVNPPEKKLDGIRGERGGGTVYT